MRMLSTNCPNCGGVLDDGKCPYCGTKVRFANEIDLLDFGSGETEICINLKKGNDTFVLPIRGRLTSVEIKPEYHTLYSDGIPFLDLQPIRYVSVVFDGIIDQNV